MSLERNRRNRSRQGTGAYGQFSCRFHENLSTRALTAAQRGAHSSSLPPHIHHRQNVHTRHWGTPPGHVHSAVSPSCWSAVHSVRLSLSSCMISVLSLYESSGRESSSAIAWSNALFASVHASEGCWRIS
jgi:hypothetical protein